MGYYDGAGTRLLWATVTSADTLRAGASTTLYRSLSTAPQVGWCIHATLTGSAVGGPAHQLLDSNYGTCS